MILDFTSRTGYTQQSFLHVLSSVQLVCWWHVTCLWGQYQIFLVDPVGRKHLMSVLREKIQRPPPEGEYCISVLSGKGKSHFIQACQGFFLHSKEQVSDVVKFPGNVLGFMWKILVYINDRHTRLLLFNNEGTCTSQGETSCWSERTPFFPCCGSTAVRMWDGKKSFKIVYGNQIIRKNKVKSERETSKTRLYHMCDVKHNEGESGHLLA